MDGRLLMLLLAALTATWGAGLYLGFYWGRKRGYEDGYDVGYAETSRYYCQGGKLPTKTLADWKRDSDAGGRAIAHTVTGSEHGDIAYPVGTERLDDMGRVYRWTGREWEQIAGFGLEMEMPQGGKCKRRK